MTVVHLVVRGIPSTQGSKRGFVVTPKGGKPRAIVRENAPGKLHAWRHAINDEARKAFGERPLLEGPVAVTIVFRMLKPKSAPKRRRTWPIGPRSGDVDKLARAVLDAITGVVIADDSQVVSLRADKDYSHEIGPGAVIVVETVEPEASRLAQTAQDRVS